MKNFYNKIKSKPTKLDKNYEKHKIMPASMIASIGMTGCGKTNALMNFLDKKRALFKFDDLFCKNTKKNDYVLCEMLNGFLNMDLEIRF